MTQTEISELYVAIFNRASEKEGNEFWQQYNSHSDAAQAMLSTSDAISYFGDNLNSNQAFVEHIYLNTLNKTNEIDSEGISYWTNLLNNGKSRGEVVSGLIDAIDSFAPNGLNYDSTDSVTIASYNQFSNRVTISDYTAQTVFSVPDNYSTSMNFKYDLSVTDDITTITTAQASMNSLSSNTIDSIDVSINYEDYNIETINSNSHWSSVFSTITYSFNTAIPSDYYLYPNNELTTGWQSLNSTQQNTVDSIMSEVDELLAISFEKVDSGGMIQFNLVDLEENIAGISLLPGTKYDYLGDIFLSTDFNTSSDDYGLNIGEYGYRTIVHELGHALGLEHSFEGTILSESLDDVNHTVMSYTYSNSYFPVLSFSSSKIYLDYTQINPDFYSLYDIAALQSIYGAELSTQNDDSIYSTSYTNYQIQTIWDAGGEDTLNLSETTGSNIVNLNSGSLNSVDKKTLDDVITIQQNIAIENNKAQHTEWIAENLTDLYNAHNLYTGIDNLAIAAGTIIENITTGSGEDVITDNSVDNTIYTNSGNDKIYLGNGGYDYIDAGEGIDTIYLSLLPDDVTTILLEDNLYKITHSSFSADITNVENIVFGNGSTLSIDLLI